MRLGFFGLFAIFALAGFAFWIWALVEVLKTPDHGFTAAGQNKLVWVLVVIFLGWVGALVYLFAGRPALRRAGAV